MAIPARARRTSSKRSTSATTGLVIVLIAFLILLTNPTIAITPIKALLSSIMGNSNSGTKSSNNNNTVETKLFIENEINSNKVVIFSKSYCPYCTSTKQTMAGLTTAKVYELDQMENGSAIQQTLAQLTGQRTVPNVFVNGKHLGGNDDTQAAAANGRLQEMLKQ